MITPVAGGKMIAYTAGDSGAPQVFQTYETGSRYNFKSTPIVVERPDGVTMLVAGLGRNENDPNDPGDGRVFAFNAVTGEVLPGWPQSTGTNSAGKSGVIGPLTSGDLDGDGVPEIVATSFSHLVTAFKLDGSTLWQYNADDTVQSGAVIGDLDRDGTPEVVFGSDTSENPFFNAGGFVNILNNKGSAKFRVPFDETIWSSPTLADLNGDGFLEIVVGTGLNFSKGFEQPPNPAAAREAANQIIALDYKGEPLPGWPYETTSDNAQDRQVYSSPAVADLNGDGNLEVVAVDLSNFLHVVQFDGTPLPGFEGGKRLVQPSGGVEDNFNSPIIADANGDGTPDIIVAARERLLAIDPQGNELFSINVPGNPNPDLRFNAAAVGQFDGTGGLELASVSNASANPNPPRTLGMYQLPESSLTPPWPMHRRFADGQAVTQNPTFIEPYIRASFRALLDREASASDIAFFSDLLLSNEWTVDQLPETLAITPESRGVVVNRLYQQYLDRAPTPDEFASAVALLGNAPASNLVKQFLLSDEFKSATDGSISGIITRMYQKVLKRDPKPEEANIIVPLVESGQVPLPAIADLLLGSEEFVLLDLIVPVVLAYRTEFPDAPFDEAAVATVLFDRTGARPEAQVRAGIVASGGNYAWTSTAAGVVRSVYGDVLHRQASPAEVATWLRRFAEGSASLPELPRTLLNSPEGRAQSIRQQTRQLLGREADQALIDALSGYSRREEVTINLISSDEYFQRNSGTVPSYVRAVFRDIAGIDPLPDSALNQWVQRINSGTPRSELPRQLVETREAYNNLIVEELFRYLPNESLGVLRTANNPGGPAVNPDPALVEALINARLQGTSDTDTLVNLLTTPVYIQKSAYIRGLFRSRGFRN